MKWRWLLFLMCLCIFYVPLVQSCEPVKTDEPPKVDPAPPIPPTDNRTGLINLPPNAVDAKTLEQVVWINPGKVFIGNLYPGAQAEWNLRIHNEKDVPVAFRVTSRPPDYTDPGYVALPYKWVIIDAKEGQVIVDPKSVKEVLITVKYNPKDRATKKKYETWISVIDATQVGMIQTELCSRWFIDLQ